MILSWFHTGCDSAACLPFGQETGEANREGSGCFSQFWPAPVYRDQLFLYPAGDGARCDIGNGEKFFANSCFDWGGMITKAELTGRRTGMNGERCGLFFCRDFTPHFYPHDRRHHQASGPAAGISKTVQAGDVGVKMFIHFHPVAIKL